MSDPILKQAAIVRALTQEKVEWTIEHRRILTLLKDRQPLPPDTPQAILKDVHLFLKMLTFVLYGSGTTNEMEGSSMDSAATKESYQ